MLRRFRAIGPFALLLATAAAWAAAADDVDPRQCGYRIIDAQRRVRFVYDPRLYGQTAAPRDGIYVAGPFNAWRPAQDGRVWRLREQRNGICTLDVPLARVAASPAAPPTEFKFVSGQGRWQELDRIPARYRRDNNLWIDVNAFRPLAERTGYTFPPDRTTITFVFAPRVFNVPPEAKREYYIVGTFNAWGARDVEGWRMRGTDDGTLYMYTTNMAAVTRGSDGFHPEFKFRGGQGEWVELDAIDPAHTRHNNLWIDLDRHGDVTPPWPVAATLIGTTELVVAFSEPVSAATANDARNYHCAALDITAARLASDGATATLAVAPYDLAAARYQVAAPLVVAELADTNGVRMACARRVPVRVDPRLVAAFFDGLPAGTQALGCTFVDNQAVFRLFGPRLQRADLLLYADATAAAPSRTLPMHDDDERIWCARVPTNLAPHGCFYRFAITRDGARTVISDPYARANVHSAGKSIVIRPEIVEPPFAGWTDT
ncbi:MAG TPA: hypothetical protein PLQ87_14280, partial [Phycisphaerae bacterium]|nr:hypothetical protein [Phycisphaerae bacterium]